MSIILKHILKNVKEKKGRSLLIICSLLIASCVFILNLTIPNQIVEANKNKTRELIGASDIVVASYENFNFEDLKLNDEKINYVGVNQLYSIHKEKTLAIYSLDIEKGNSLSLVYAKELNNDEIIINSFAAEKFGYKVNDIITLNINDKDYDLKIANILDSKGLLYLKSYSAIINVETFNKMLDIETNNYSTYYIDVEENDNIDSFEKYIKDNNENYIVQKLVDEEAIKENTSYISMILMIIFVMAVIMIFFVVNTLNKMIVIERVPVMATFRSVGATKHKMNLILILENVVYGLIGGILGSVLSLAINNLCAKLLLGGESLDTSMPFKNLIFGVIFAIILEVLMSIGAIIKSNKYSIKELMFENRNSKYSLNKISTVVSIIFIISSILLNIFVSDNNVALDVLEIVMFWLGAAFIVPLMMALISKVICFFAKKIGGGSLIIASKNLGSNKMLISSIRLVVISIAIMLVIFNLSNTFDNMLNSFSYQFEGYDIFIRDLSKEASVYEELSSVKGVENFEFVYTFGEDITYNDAQKFDTNPVILGMKKSRPDIEELDYKIKDLKENEMLIDEIFAENNNIKVGDALKLKLEDYDKEFEFKVVGKVNSFYFSIQREIIIINEDFFTENISKVPFQIAISAKENTDLNVAINNIENKFKDPDMTIMTVEQFVESQRSNIHTIMYLFYIIIGLALVLSFVGIINNQIISFMERTKEFAVLNSVCMSKGQLIKMLIIENLTSNIVACIVGFIVSIGSVNIINSLLNGIRMYIGLKFDLSIALVFIGAVLVVLFITVIVPIIKLKKINVVEAIKYE